MDITHSAKRVYKHSQLGLWLRRVERDWERPFKSAELEYGRHLYKTCAIRTLELNENEAIICARMEDGSEPYCVIDFEGDRFVYRSSDESSLLTAALTVAGMYEISELVGDVLGSDEFIDYDESSSNKVQEIETPPAEAHSLPVEDEPVEIFKTLSLTFSSRRKGLIFTANWELPDGKTRRAFGGNCIPVSKLKPEECENLIRLATLARKASFKYEADSYVLSDISKIPGFLKVELDKWREFFKIRKDANVDMLSYGERKVELRPVARPVRGDSADFDVKWTPCIDGEEIDESEMSKLVGGVGSLRIIPEFGIVRVSASDTAFVREVERGRDFGFKEGKIPRYMLLALSDGGARMGLAGELKKWMKSLSEPGRQGNPLGLPQFLRKYQVCGVEWAVRLFEHDCNAMIADEMGLGKTLQTLSIIDYYLRSKSSGEKKFLVVCPASVIPVWISEVKKFFPAIKCGVLTSKGIDANARLLIASYTQLRRNKSEIDKIKFELAVLDEAQFIKNPDAKTTVACMGINAARKIALTGTPVENRLLDMWTAFRWLMPGLMGTRKAFEEMIASKPDAVAQVRRQISPFVLRRLKTEVASELPEKIYIDLMCPMTDFQASEYQKLLSKAREELRDAAQDASLQRNRFTILSLLTRLRQAACDAALLPWIGAGGAPETGGKISVLSDRAEELYQGGKKVLVFSQFTKFLDLIKSNLIQKIGAGNIYELTGSTRDRASPVEAFQSAKGGALMLVSLRAGGTGITLTSADYVFMADPWWNPAVEEQAVDRVHRIGRKGDVFIYRMIAQDTVEDRVRRLQSQKKKLFNDLLGGLKDVSNQTKFLEAISDIIC